MDDSDGVAPFEDPNKSTGQASIDPPEFNKAKTELELEAKTVKTAQHAFRICTALEVRNRERAERAADMQALHDGRPPKSGQRAKAKAWEANASTLWLAGIVGRVAQRFVNAIISQPWCTASALPESYLDWKTKTDFLRAKFTSLIRSWDGNTGFINQVAVETVLQGYGYAVFLDPYTWQPSFFKQEECFVPEKSLQHARTLQFFACKRDFRLDQFIDLFRNEKAAEDIGYNIKNCEEAANKAQVQDPREGGATFDPRRFVDMINEGAIGLSIGDAGERVVKTWMLFNREYDGEVSCWLLERDTGKLLRFSFKEFKRMQDLMAIFTFEAGNGTIHSSKGLGRKLAALAQMKELFRCGIVDTSRMSGLLILLADAAQKSKFDPAILAPFLVLDKSVTVSPQQFEINAEALKVVDVLIDSWAEQAVGAYLAAQVTDKGRTERTATEATIDSRRENEAADIMIRRCLDQDATRIQMQQLRVFTDENLRRAHRIADKLAEQDNPDYEEIFPKDIDECNLMRCLVECIQVDISDDEMKTWAKSQASAFAHVTEGAIQRGVGVVMAELGQNPNINQQELIYARVESLVGADMAKRLVIPSADQTLTIEAARKQQQETLTMAQIPVPVSPRDNHMAEMPTLVSFLENVGKKLLQESTSDDAAIQTVARNLDHLGEHLKLAAQSGDNKLPAFKTFDEFYQGLKKDLAQVVVVREEAKVAQEMAAQTVRTEQPLAPVEPIGSEVPGSFEAGPAPGAIEPALAVG
jgi:hypothetical protein